MARPEGRARASGFWRAGWPSTFCSGLKPRASSPEPDYMWRKHMRRARVAPIVLVVSVVASAAGVRAQSAAVPEGWVVLPVDEYRALRERAIPSQPAPLPPPIDATLTRIDYDLHVEAEAVAGRAMLTIDVLRDGWSKLPIPAGLMVRDAALDGRRVS